MNNNSAQAIALRHHISLLLSLRRALRRKRKIMNKQNRRSISECFFISAFIFLFGEVLSDGSDARA